MTKEYLLEQIETLPDNLQQEVADFIGFLQEKYVKKNPPKERVFGIAKGMYEMAPDFDEPLEDFEEYMK